MISRRTALHALAAAAAVVLVPPRLALANTSIPAGWTEDGVTDRKTVLTTKLFIARGDDRDLAAALKSVPASVTQAAVRIA